jgi:hypothetical protein
LKEIKKDIKKKTLAPFNPNFYKLCLKTHEIPYTLAKGFKKTIT